MTRSMYTVFIWNLFHSILRLGIGQGGLGYQQLEKFILENESFGKERCELKLRLTL